jgi:CelD/BcsL family acetyltransferase involved in cellulose biosynthesis
MRRDDERALLSLLSRWNGTANGRRSVDMVRELLECPRLPADLKPTLAALAALDEARRIEESAYDARVNAEVALAEIVGVNRRDKDTGFDAECAARDLIVNAALDAAKEAFGGES